MRRENIQFAEKDQALRNDVHMLGVLIGDLIKEQSGQKLYDFVENARLTAIENRNQDISDNPTLKVLLKNLEPVFATEVIRSSKEEEIMDLQNRIQEFQTRAQQSLQKKEAEIMEPLIKKAKDAINEVAKANGYTYIFDSGAGALLYFPEGDDILPLVKVKMGIK